MFFWLITSLSDEPILADPALQSILLLFTFVYFLFIWALFYRSWLDYYLDYWIVTNYRIINAEHQGLFNWTVAEHLLSKIQDVSAHQKGMIATLFDYGNVKIQTAAEESKFNFEQVPKPQACAQAVQQLIVLEQEKEKK